MRNIIYINQKGDKGNNGATKADGVKFKCTITKWPKKHPAQQETRRTRGDKYSTRNTIHYYLDSFCWCCIYS